MTKTFKILFIDDNPIDEEVEAINRALVKNNIAIEPIVIDMKNKTYFKRHAKHGTILDPKKIQEQLLNNGVMDTDFDIVACDFNFSDEFYDGYKLLISLINTARDKRKLIRNAKFLFYTGDTNTLEAKASSDLKRLLSIKIESIVERQNLPQELIRLINKFGSEINLEKMFLSLIHEHGEKTFLSTFPRFSGKTLSYIGDEIERETDNGKQFLECLVEQSVSHLIDLQED